MYMSIVNIGLLLRKSYILIYHLLSGESLAVTGIIAVCWNWKSLVCELVVRAVMVIYISLSLTQKLLLVFNIECIFHHRIDQAFTYCVVQLFH